MRINLKWMIVALAAIALLGTGTVSASSSAPSPESQAYLSGRASTILAEIQAEAGGARAQCGDLGDLRLEPPL